MLESRVARTLMLMGAGIGVLSVAVWALDVQVNVPDWMIRVAMFKLAAIASVGLLAAGALVGRHAKTSSLAPGASPAQVGEGEARPLRPPGRDVNAPGVERESGAETIQRTDARETDQ